MNKTVLITGASRGIGAAAAKKFCAQGWRVVVNYHRSEQAAKKLVESLTQHGGQAIAVQADVSQADQAQALVQQTVAAFGTLDAVVCNAGQAHVGLLTDMTPTHWQACMAVNLDSVFYTLHGAIPHMVGQKSGAIVTVSSMWGVTGASCEAAYSAAKAGVIGLSRALAKELGPSGIRVNCVAPGVIDTDMNSNFNQEDLALLCQDTPLCRIGTPEEVADSIYFLCSDQAGFITGQVLQPNGGLVI